MVSFVLDLSLSLTDYQDLPEAGDGDHGDDIYDVDACDDGKNDEPEPESDIDLLIDDVEGEDAHGIVLLNCTWRSVFVEGAFGYSGKYHHHGISSIVILFIDEVENVSTISHEDTAEEEIDEVHLPDDIDEVENVANEVLDGVHVVHAFSFIKILHQFVAAISEWIIGDVDAFRPETVGDFVEFLVLECFPKVVRDVEHDALEEEDERDPLVVGVEYVVALLVNVLRPHAGVGVVLSLHTVLGRWDAESGHNPAVGVEDIAGDGVVDAGDGGADEIIGGDEEAADEEDGGGGAVVQLEERGVDVCFCLSMSDLYKASHRHQQSHYRHLQAGGLQNSGGSWEGVSAWRRDVVD